MFELLIAILGAYGISTLIADYDGPAQMFCKLRRMKYKLFECNVCLIPYFAVAMSLLLGLSLAECFAVIGGAIVIARLT